MVKLIFIHLWKSEISFLFVVDRNDMSFKHKKIKKKIFSDLLKPKFTQLSTKNTNTIKNYFKANKLTKYQEIFINEI